MKKLVVAVAAMILAGAAQAETSVNLYGLVDAGVTYVNNTGGNSAVRMDSGVMNGNRWGLKGREELGNGIAGVFQVESGFSLDNGEHGQNGKLFGRQAFAGVDVENVGKVTFGRQYDFMDDIGDYSTVGNQFGGVYAENNFHSVDGIGGNRVDNSIKFRSANFSGVSFGVMAGLGAEDASNKKSGRVMSAKLGYDGFPGLSVGAAYVRSNGTGLNASDKTDNVGVGAAYDLGFGSVNGLVTMTKLNYNAPAMTDIKLNAYELGYTHRITPQLSAGLGLQYLDNRTDGAKKQDLYGGTVAVDYAFSKRTDAYGLVAFQQAKKDNGAYMPVDITGAGAADTNKQVAVRVGLRHRF